MSLKLARFAPLSGVVFLVLIAVVLFAFPESPDPDASTVRVVAYWHDHRTALLWQQLIGALAAVALIWFGGSLREAIHKAEGGGRLGALALAGATVAGIGGLLFSGIALAAADTVGEVPAEVTQTLSVLENDLFFPFTGGLFVMMIAAALASLYWGVLPKWLGWVAVVIAIAAFTPWTGFWAFVAFFLWVGVVGVWLFARQPSTS
jgi:hypothetical protein